jgi:diguanylate cyclase (GGDEF)-like protein/PAS domain S-box-containing protein
VRSHPVDDHDADYWAQQIRIGALIAAGVTLLGALRVLVDWSPDRQWWAGPVLAAVVVQVVAACLPWRRIIQRPHAQQLLIGWWVAEIPVLYLFSLVDEAGITVYLPGATLVVVLAAALYPPGVVLAIGALSLSGYLGLLPFQGPFDAVYAIGMLSIMTSVVAINVLNARSRRRLDRRRRSAERRTEAMLENSSDLVFALGEQGRVHYASASAGPRLGFVPADLTGATLSGLVHPADLPQLTEWMATLWAAPDGHTARTETRVRQADGSWSYFDVIGTNSLHDPDLRAVIVSLRDIGVRRALEEELRHQAFTDSLTGLPNRALFRDRLEHAAARRREGTSVSVLLIDLDDFKNVNDNLGHSAGDELLTVLAGRLRAQVRPGDTLARLGGDEFAVLVEELNDGEAAALAERFLQETRTVVRLAGGGEITCTCSIGVATMDPGDGDQAEQLLRNADLAMYAAKRAGGDACVAFDPAMYAAVLHEAQQRTDMEQALEREEFVVHYQPVVDLPTKELIGVEALVRWQHPRKGMLGPDFFIHDAEESGLIVPLGRWVLRVACAQLGAWQRELPAASTLKMNVNLSARQFQYQGLVDDVAAALRDGGIAPGSLTLEITESMVMQNIESTIETLQALRDLGVRLAIDDFGTGYSSLSYLQRLPVDIIKIDRAFVQHVDSDAGNMALVDAVVNLGAALDLQTVAEGVETSDQWDKLRELGCEFGQGYLFGKPAGPGQITALLGDHTDHAESSPELAPMP